MASTYILIFLRAVVGFAFLLALVSKLRNMSSFRAALSAMRLVPERWVGTVALLALIGEGAVIVLIVPGSPALQWGLWLAALLLGIFTGVIAVTLKRQMQVACNCFGAHSTVLSKVDLVRNVGFLVCALLGAWLSRAEISDAHPPGWEWIAIAAVAAMLVGLWVELNEITRLFR